MSRLLCYHNMSGKKHVLILTFPAFGHIIPALELARKVAKHHHVTFAASESKITDMLDREIFSNEASENIKLYPLHDKALGDFDESGDTTAWWDIIFDSCFPAVRDLILAIPCPHGTGDHAIMKPVDVIFSEVFLAEELQMCRERAIPFYVFDTTAAWLTRFYAEITDKNISVVPDDQLDSAFYDFPRSNNSPIETSPVFAKLFLPIKKIWPYTVGMIHNDFKAMDKKDLDILKRHPDTKHVPHFAVGPLLPETDENASKANRALTYQVKTWMKRKAPRSVIYLSFGSLVVPSPEQISQIAQALLKLKKPFIWSLRENKQDDLPEEILSAIPSQFDNPDSGFLILPWAPQKEILADPATAVIVSHCGWNGVLESVANGVPVVGWPFFADQLNNARWLVKAGMGELVEGTGLMAERVVPMEEVREIIAKVAGFDGTGDRYFRAAQTWKKEADTAVRPGGSSYEDLFRLCEFKEMK